MKIAVALLDARERLLLQRLSVFAGDVAIEQIETVCSGDGLDHHDILDTVAALVDKSLVVVRESDVAHDLRAEYCVRVVGTVRVRPEGNRNDALPTGAVEVAASEVEVLSAAAPLPFPLDDDAPIGDEVRLKYR